MNYSEKGVRYTTYQQDIKQGIGGYMPETGVNALLGLFAALNADAVDRQNHPWIGEYLGTPHHLEGILFTVESIVEQLNYLQKNLLSPEPCIPFPKTIVKREGHQESLHSPPALIGVSSKRLEIEAETYLHKAFSAVERVGQLIDSQCQLGGTYHFHRIPERLRERQGDVRCAELLELISQVTPVFTKTIHAASRTNHSLRNAIAHRASSPKLMDKAFSVQWLDNGEVMAFDAEYGEFPLVGTIRDLTKAIPFFVLQAIKVMLVNAPQGSQARAWSEGQTFNIDGFEPTWRNPFLHFSAGKDPEEKGPVISVLRWMPGGFQTHQTSLKVEVLKLAVQPQRIEG